MLALRESPLSLLRLRELCETLEKDEQLLQNFFNFSPDLLAVIDSDGLFLHVNQSWHKLLGWTEEAINRMPILYLIHQDDQAAMREAINQLNAHNLDKFVCRIRHNDGHCVPIEFSATKWRGNVSNLIGRITSEACLSCPEARLTWRANGCDNICKNGKQ